MASSLHLACRQEQGWVREKGIMTHKSLKLRVCVQWTMIAVSVYQDWKPCSATAPLQCHKTNTWHNIYSSCNLCLVVNCSLKTMDRDARCTWDTVFILCGLLRCCRSWSGMKSPSPLPKRPGSSATASRLSSKQRCRYSLMKLNGGCHQKYSSELSEGALPSQFIFILSEHHRTGDFYLSKHMHVFVFCFFFN